MSFLQLYVAFFFFFNDTATTEIYTLSLHDALPISRVALSSTIIASPMMRLRNSGSRVDRPASFGRSGCGSNRSEEHTSELQSRQYLVCRLLLEKKKKKNHHAYMNIPIILFSLQYK